MRPLHRLAIAACACFMVAGCYYGPEHLPSLRMTRDQLDRLIFEVEYRNGIDPPSSYQAQIAAQEGRLLELEAQLRAGLETQEVEEARIEALLTTLTPEQKLRWAIHRDHMRLRREILLSGRLSVEELRSLLGELEEPEPRPEPSREKPPLGAPPTRSVTEDPKDRLPPPPPPQRAEAGPPSSSSSP